MTTKIAQQLAEIITILDKYPDGLSRGQLSDKLSFSIHDKTLQRRLGKLFDDGRITKKGKRKATRYHPLQVSTGTIKGQFRDNLASIFSPKSKKRLQFLETPLHARERVSYNRVLLDSYVPNQSNYVPEKMRDTLFQEGKRFDEQLALDRPVL
jgi:predicted transcriptional regulator